MRKGDNLLAISTRAYYNKNQSKSKGEIQMIFQERLPDYYPAMYLDGYTPE